MPALTVATDAPTSKPGQIGGCARRVSTSRSRVSRSPSPLRPPVSPITPPLNVTQLPGTDNSLPQTALPPPSAPVGPDFARGRPVLAPPLSQPDHSVIGGVVPVPVPEPVVFEENTDVLALQSAISILQMQRSKATADIQTLARVKKAALADPLAFTTDLGAGRVRTEGDLLFVETRDGPFDESSSSEEDKDEEPADDRSGAGDMKMQDADADAESDTGHAEPGESSGMGAVAVAADAKVRRRRKAKEKSSAGPSSATDVGPKSWRKLPKPQNVVRCPPINWAQYGIVGESLDKLHAEQVAAPAQGVPAVLGSSGTFQFRAGEPVSTGEQRRLVGVAAPFTPGRDKLDKKKGARR